METGTKKDEYLYDKVTTIASCLFSLSGPSAKASEEDQERTRRLADAEMHRHHLESLLDQRDREITALREVTAWRCMAPGPCQRSTIRYLRKFVSAYRI